MVHPSANTGTDWPFASWNSTSVVHSDCTARLGFTFNEDYLLLDSCLTNLLLSILLTVYGEISLLFLEHLAMLLPSTLAINC